MSDDINTVVDGYAVRNGIIVSPGKFEGAAAYTPHFYDASMTGDGEVIMTMEDDGIWASIFQVQASDLQKFPSLAGHDVVLLLEDDAGNVICLPFTTSKILACYLEAVAR